MLGIQSDLQNTITVTYSLENLQAKMCRFCVNYSCTHPLHSYMDDATTFKDVLHIKMLSRHRIHCNRTDVLSVFSQATIESL